MEEQIFDHWYNMIIDRAWMSLIAAGHQVKEIKIYIVLDHEYGIWMTDCVDAWLGGHEEIKPIWPEEVGDGYERPKDLVEKFYKSK
jgi:hypothetical protein